MLKGSTYQKVIFKKTKKWEGMLQRDKKQKERYSKYSEDNSILGCGGLFASSCLPYNVTYSTF